MKNEKLSVSLIRRPQAGKYKIVYFRPPKEYAPGKYETMHTEIETFDNLEDMIDKINELQNYCLPSCIILSIDKIEATYDINVDI